MRSRQVAVCKLLVEERAGGPLFNKRNSIRNTGSNSSALADNTPPVDSTLGQTGSNRSSRTGNNRDCSNRGLRARSRGRKLQARAQRRRQG